MANLDQIANYQADRVVKTYTAQLSDCSVDSGSINSVTVEITYTIDTVLHVRAETRLVNVANGAHPAVTINNVPADMPAFRSMGYTLRRQGTNAAIPSDPCYIYRTANDTKLYIQSYNYIGQAPAGYVYYAI